MVSNQRDRELYAVTPARSLKDIPTAEHWAVIVHKTDSIWVPGDERSRVAPGHGYPEHTEHIETIQYFSFPTQAAAVEYVEYLVGQKYTPTPIENIRVSHVLSSISPRMKVAVEIELA